MKFIQRQRHWIVLIWGLLLLVFYACISYQAISTLNEDRVYSSRLHRERLDPRAMEEDKTQVDFSKLAPPDGKLKKVSVGIYVDRIVEISTKATDWTVDFYLWFNWRGNSIDPGKDFQVIDGEILSKTKDESDTVGDRSSHDRPSLSVAGPLVSKRSATVVPEVSTSGRRRGPAD